MYKRGRGRRSMTSFHNRGIAQRNAKRNRKRMKRVCTLDGDRKECVWRIMPEDSKCRAPFDVKNPDKCLFCALETREEYKGVPPEGGWCEKESMWQVCDYKARQKCGVKNKENCSHFHVCYAQYKDGD